jgi:succinate dehydrogenase/fumarate reductase flavoprotein subunit
MATSGNGAEGHIADVVVVGSGAAGCTAALRAAADGNDVLVLETAPHIGGTTARSSGGYWIPNNSLMRARGIEDPRDDALRYMARLSFPDRYDPGSPTLGLDRRDLDLLEVYYDRASEAVDWLTDREYISTIEMVGFTGQPGDFPPYYEMPDLDRAPYGRHLGAAYDQEGVDAAAGAAIRGQGGLPPAVGGQGDGAELSRQFSSAMRRAGVRVLCEHRVDGILTAGDAVGGVSASTPSGSVRVRARKGVVFASGGFSVNAELCDRFLRGPIYGTGAAPSCVGDFIGLAEGLGAELGNLENAWWCQVPLEPALERRVLNWLMFVPWGDSMVIVNREGRRVVNEKALYNDRGPAHFIGGAERGWPNRVLMMIYDDGVARSEMDWVTRWPIPMPEGELSLRAAGIDERALVISGNTFTELEQNIKLRLAGLAGRTGGFELDRSFASGLRETVDRFNRYAASGVDPEFHRGEPRVQKEMNGPPRPGNDGNPTMFPFRESGPYHCILLGAGTLETKGGPRVDPRARVVRADGTPIPRLYGAGNCIANPTAEAYWSGGATLGTAIALGYIAGEQVGQEAPVGPLAQLAAN